MFHKLIKSQRHVKANLLIYNCKNINWICEQKRRGKVTRLDISAEDNSGLHSIDPCRSGGNPFGVGGWQISLQPSHQDEITATRTGRSCDETRWVNFIKILSATFLPIFWCQKIAKPNVIREKLLNFLLYEKCWWNWHKVGQFHQNCTHALFTWKCFVQLFSSDNLAL